MQEKERQTGMDVRGPSQQPRGQVSSEGRERQLTQQSRLIHSFRCTCGSVVSPVCLLLQDITALYLPLCVNFNLLISSVFATYVICRHVMRWAQDGQRGPGGLTDLFHSFICSYL